MEPNPNGFPLNDAKYQEISVIGDPNYQLFDIRVYLVTSMTSSQPMTWMWPLSS